MQRGFFIMDNEVAVKISKLTKSYKKVDVLKGIDLEIEKGSIFALLGPNGAGKTTTIKILSTLIKPDSGEVMMAGINVLKNPQEVKKHIALTGQYAAVDEVLTGRENLRMVGKLLRVDNLDKKVEGLLKRFDIMDEADRRVSTYSGGMKRKIDIAMSLLGNPGIIFLDEPTTGLDPQSRKTMWKMIRHLSDTGVTIFLTTQHLDEAEALADKIAILDKGVIIAQGTNEEIKSILPSNIIELCFNNSEETDKAAGVLNEYNLTRYNSHFLRIETREGAGQVLGIFDVLRDADIEIENFEKKKASLEDVFLKVISSESGGSESHVNIS
jgi:ABC-2 type transport system ATP-binding protein